MARHTPKDAELIFKSIENDDDRSVALVGASLLEHSLEYVIQSRLREFHSEKDKVDIERLFGINGIFAGLSAKIVGGYALKLFGPLARRDLELINKIRNEFAHDMNPLHFADAHIKSRCKELDCVKESIPAREGDARNMYVTAIQLFSGMLYLRAVELEPAFKDTPGASDAASSMFVLWLDK